MMRYRKEVNDRSPMRVFDRAIHGGLGLGNVGVVFSPPGVGKSAVLVQLALDDLMRGRKVLHVSLESPVERVRAYYDEIVHDLSLAYQLSQPHLIRVDVERHRMIVAHLQHGSSDRAGALSGLLGKLLSSVAFCRDVAQFEPQTILIDGFDFEAATPEHVARLRQLATDTQVELWVTARSHETERVGDKEPAMPASIARYASELQVIVSLSPDADAVRLRLLKDHDNPDVGPLDLWLDPATMRVIDSAMPPLPVLPKDPRRFHLYSGGAQGAEATFGECAERWGIAETHYSFEGHPFLSRSHGLVVLPEDELVKGDFSLVYASHRMKRPLSNIPNIKRILQTVWHQITQADEVFVIGSIQEDGTVRGGTGWGAELARLWSKSVAVYDQERGAWYRWDITRWEQDDGVVIRRPNFAGIGTVRLTSLGRAAIEQLFVRSFGAPPSGPPG